MYPFIDAANGGTINGYINALNAIIDITVPSNVNEGGTMVIPGHGRLSDEQDVIEYRDMRHDRPRPHPAIRQARHDARAGEGEEADARLRSALRRDTGFWTTAMFIEAVYRDLSGIPTPTARTQ